MVLRLSPRRSTLAVLTAAAFVVAPLSASARPPARGAAKPAAAAPGSVVVFSTTTGATVEIDGKPVGTIPLKDPIMLEPGQHSIRVHLRGWTEHIDTFTVPAGDEVELEIDLIPSAGIVKIVTPQPGATVKVNGKVVGVTPFDQDVPVGTAEINVSMPGYKDQTRTVEVTPGKAYDLDFQLEALPNAGPIGGAAGSAAFYETWWFWTAIGVAAAGAGAAVALSGDTAQAPTPNWIVNVP